MASGTVKWFSDIAGFGYINPDGGGSDVYAHHSEIVGQDRASLQAAQRVTYEAASGPKGPTAVNIRPE